MFPSTPPPTSAHLFLPLSSLGPTGGLPDMPPPLSSSVCALLSPAQPDGIRLPETHFLLGVCHILLII